MPIPVDKELYAKAKRIADQTYSKPSAYKSGFIVKTYKEMGGRYREDGEPRNLQRWYKEEWKDVGGLDYPVFRPTKRVNSKTPLTVSEIDPKDLKKKILIKQHIKGTHNLKPFKPV
jgi:hypothetical protein